jgi:hypothetical protein
MSKVKQAGWPRRKNGAVAFGRKQGLGTDKERWQEIRDGGFLLQGMKSAASQAAEWWQGAVLIIPPFFV